LTSTLELRVCRERAIAEVPLPDHQAVIVTRDHRAAPCMGERQIGLEPARAAAHRLPPATAHAQVRGLADGGPQTCADGNANSLDAAGATTETRVPVHAWTTLM